VNIVYEVHGSLTRRELADVFAASGIRRPVEDLARMEKMIAAADLIVTAREDGRLVGVARSLTDFCFACYLSDLAVDRSHQRRGVGKELVRLTRQAIGPQTTLLLIAAPEAMAYYPKIGFEPMNRAWWIDRTR
jgi:predicted N-acetyltransferase YhbS